MLVIKQAQQILAKSQEQEYVRQFGAELDEIKGMDASIKSIEDVLNSPQKSAILQKINAGYSLVDAYKLCNFDRLTAANAQAGKQAAINSLRSKNHMTQTGGVTDTTTDMEIPTAELNRWKEMFPDATDKELRAKYTRATRALG